METVVDDTHKSFEINVIGVLRTVYAFLPLIQAGKEKKVVAISSGHGDIGQSFIPLPVNQTQPKTEYSSGRSHPARVIMTYTNGFSQTLSISWVSLRVLPMPSAKPH